MFFVDKVRVSGKTWEPSAEWVKGNIGHTGFYRVNYPVENWKLLAQQLEFNHKVCYIVAIDFLGGKYSRRIKMSAQLKIFR